MDYLYTHSLFFNSSIAPKPSAVSSPSAPPSSPIQQENSTSQPQDEADHRHLETEDQEGFGRPGFFSNKCLMSLL
ncbi:MAG: hypothetical protein L6R35_001052 [Caloplaca aegaea]|nr:MAG: hypothetical protein L6R35_001052 [Caloplaca aegaea]